jgi:mannosyltransferase OCH1-like enzyme
VVLRLGGAYADVDAECRAPLDAVIAPADTLLVGWDTEVPADGDAAGGGGAPNSLARRRLVANWFFAAAPGHPVLREVCDFIARHAGDTFSANGARDTAERTGQGLWSDVVLRHALQHAPAKVGARA